MTLRKSFAPAQTQCSHPHNGPATTIMQSPFSDPKGGDETIVLPEADSEGTGLQEMRDAQLYENHFLGISSITFRVFFSLKGCCRSVSQLCPTFCDPMDGSTPGFPVLQCLSEFA